MHWNRFVLIYQIVSNLCTYMANPQGNYRKILLIGWLKPGLRITHVYILTKKVCTELANNK